ncbi:triose-phosphate isomerase [Poseidonibacter ostreae]|jgi:triosephosphate isomerase (TIM)|uniref:Triosephosphate isomerase n=1 Tax=Poseidonibacter ostreae TaxID=2654171 RepID=A0A6L4WTV0_9BACT|nr:triose-phosphate isomerase [Poseidonibacter ostreae]KAB7886012.1 triose-phosphate isomerase [Poseidonibacter ostreae]KAB7889464.1 triose-phosphate isomerase [Poseidonibacter ostreae]KAB7892521.1 triose-phosphate isomerase [Poseidonibacter ostreae]MAC83582.1 triose-phosphate isomerase [Arcobacter sp.]|tara:strand:+ start:2851 stop:3561 length:711 start_codon:yes stop_codon:yes gene_type:complete
MSIIASNFKTNHTRKSTASFVKEVNDFLVSEEISNDVYIFPTSTSLDSFDTVSNFNIGAQNAYATQKGSFTGEIGTEQLEEFEIKTILIGHSERRHILGESQEEIAKKFSFYSNLGYKIIYCIGEPLEVKEQGIEQTLEYVYEQFVGIDTNYENLILAYEPVWAIGTGVTATNDDITSVHSAIKSKINKPLLYGGSVKVANVRDICALPGVDGALIGTASWILEDFKQIIKNTKDL